MSHVLAVQEVAEIMEKVVAGGDLQKLTAVERLGYYDRLCQSLGLNPLTRPFEYITLNGKLTLYARKDATDQLRKVNGVSIVRLERERLDDLYVVTAFGQDKSGRSDSAIGAVSIRGLSGEALANALMKAETKAKRRVTLSLCGLGWADETEIESIPGARTIVVDTTTGEVVQEIPTRPATATDGAAGGGIDDAFNVDAPTEPFRCVDCQAEIVAQTGERITPTQADLIVERFGKLVCKNHLPATKPRQTVAA